MSYGVRLTATVPTTVHEAGITSNLGPMFRQALGYGLKDLPTDATACIEPLERAVHDMIVSPDTYRELNPPNGWGDYDGALTFLQRLLQACREYPNAAVEIHS